MRVFLSWSGERGKELARRLRTALPSFLPGVEPFFSPMDIEKGSVWRDKLAQELARSDAAVLCLTPEALRSPWVMFEAGAVANALGKGRLCPVLFGVNPETVKGPVGDYQLTAYDREDVQRLVESLNRLCGRRAIGAGELRHRFDARWPRMDRQVKATLERFPATEADFLEQLRGWWWERIRSPSSGVLSWFEMKVDPRREGISLEGTSYRANGSREAHWASGAACIDRENRKVLYYWQGEHYRRSEETFGGFGELTFRPETVRGAPSARIDRGDGIFSDQSLAKAGPLKKKRVDLRRATAEEIRTMSSGTPSAVKGLVQRTLRALG